MGRLLVLFTALLLSGLAPAAIRLNEVVASNQAGLQDERGNHPDWIELHNGGTEDVDLVGWALSDNENEPGRWRFRSGRIPAGGFLVVFASGEDRQPPVASAMEPTMVAGLVTWLRADTLPTQSGAQIRTVGAERFVRRWPDLSGKGNPASQESSSRQPRWIGGATPAVRFDGVDDLLRLPRIAATNDFTLVAVVRPSAMHEVDSEGFSGVGGTSGQRWLFGAQHGGDFAAGVGVSAGTNGVSLYEHGSGYMPAVKVAETYIGDRPSIVTVVYEARSPGLTLHGAELAPLGESPRAAVTTPTEIGAGSYGAFQGDVLEILIFDRALNRVERRGVELALAARLALPLRSVFHAEFRVAASGEWLGLHRPDGSLADAVEVPAMPADVAWGRYPDGTDTLQFFAAPTPAASNSSEGADSVLEAPRFSRPAGFYAAPFALEIQAAAESVEIRYTLDGTVPTPTSPLYSVPLGILDRTLTPPRLANISTAPSWRAPSGNLFKGTTVRARAFRSRSLPSPVVTATYFVTPRGRARYSLPIVALSTDPKNFFSAETGIYVVGNAPGGNYAQTGAAWERPVHVEFLESDGTLAFSREAGVRMHGNTSFGFPIKALRLHASNQGGVGPFRHRIFPDLPIETFERLLLRPSGHDHHLTLMRDGLMQSAAGEIGLDVQGYRPAIVFLNGEYWGIHNLQEALEEGYFEAHFPGVDADQLDYLEGYPPGTFAYAGSVAHFHRLDSFLRTNEITAPGAFEWVRSQMDVDNYRDYKFAEVFYYRWDIGNHRLWRPRAEDGRLRWILFDCDVGFGGFWSEPEPWNFDMLRAALEPSGSLHGHNNETTIFLLKTLLEHPGFRDDFINRAADLMNSTFASDRFVERIDRMAAEIAPEVAEHTARWRYPASLAEWNRNVSSLRTFARNRPDAMRRHWMEYFGLSGTANVRLAVSPTEGGVLRCNTLEDLPGPTGQWEGIYFRHHPVIVEARAKPGWRFAGWRELPGNEHPTVRLAMTSEVTLTALFERESTASLAILDRKRDGAIRLLLKGPLNATLVLEVSDTMMTWSPLASIVVNEAGEAEWDLPVIQAAQFLRLRLPP